MSIEQDESKPDKVDWILFSMVCVWITLSVLAPGAEFRMMAILGLQTWSAALLIKLGLTEYWERNK